jgi:hypothetical protein
MNDRPSHRRLGICLLTLAMLLAACTGASPTTAPSAPPDSAPPEAPASAPPDGGQPGIGLGGGRLVIPRPGQLDVHPVPIDLIEATVDGSTIIVTATWTSGVEPCNILDTIVVDRGDGSFTITLREGHGPEEVACIAIAEQHRTRFEIPDVPAGSYRILDAGSLATPSVVTVG